MHFEHSPEIWGDYPELVPGVVFAEGITPSADTRPSVAKFQQVARLRLASSPEGALPEIQAWRRVFSKMGLKPTQYRCASEALLRRFKKENALPAIHPLIDLCNALSLAFAVPIAVFDVAKIADFAEVRYAAGDETYLAFSGETENPEPREVIFADRARKAHARRWTNRQSAYSAVRNETRTVLIVAEAMHEGAEEEIDALMAALADELKALWGVAPKAQRLRRSSPRFAF
jgi:DNA/RNA-binding domain of Phe-tRNA-synthetase-like protein